MTQSPRIPADRRSAGERAEDLVALHVERHGWSVVARNVRRREGEIDLIALDGHTLVFGEVKALMPRDGVPGFSPLESIGPRKQRRIRMLAAMWLADGERRAHLPGRSFSTVRFDAFAVTLGRDGAALDLDHRKGAF